MWIWQNVQNKKHVSYKNKVLGPIVTAGWNAICSLHALKSHTNTHEIQMYCISRLLSLSALKVIYYLITGSWCCGVTILQPIDAQYFLSFFFFFFFDFIFIFPFRFSFSFLLSNTLNSQLSTLTDIIHMRSVCVTYLKSSTRTFCSIHLSVFIIKYSGIYPSIVS